METRIATFLLTTVTILLLQTGSVASYGISCDSSYKAVHNPDDCQVTANSGYDGPASFEAIFAGEPTTPAQYSDELVEATKTYSISIIAGTIGAIPVVGSMISGLFTGLTAFFPGPSWQSGIEQLYEDLAQEVENLKLYVDQAVTKLEIKIVQQQLGGLYQSVDNCRTYTDAQQMLHCLVGLQTVILADWFFFMPSIPGTLGQKYTFPSITECTNTAAELEHILPLWRHYGDILINVGMEKISSQRQAGDDQQAESFAAALIVDIDEMVDYYQRALRIIKCNSVTLSDYEGRVCQMHTGTGCCITKRTYDQSEWQGTFGPGGASFTCKTAFRVGCKHPDSYNEADRKAVDELRHTYYVQFEGLRQAAVDSYYNTQFGTTVDSWIAIRDNLQKQISQEAVAIAKQQKKAWIILHNNRDMRTTSDPDSGLVPVLAPSKASHMQDNDKARVQGVTKRKSCSTSYFPHYAFCDDKKNYCVSVDR